MSFSPSKALFCLSFLTFVLVGCGSGSSSPPPPPSITITSTPATSAEEGVQYSYQLAATASNSSPVTFSLATAPSSATFSGSTISWTPTHAESRVSNSFMVTATTSAGGSAAQSWTVTPNGTVNITAVTTYWTPSGSTNVSPQWNASLPYPAALVPQSDGSLQRLQGAANADGSFSIPDVPAGYYWLQINPNANYWTQTSDFDDGIDVVGHRLATTAQTATTFNLSVSGLQATTMSPRFLLIQSDLRGFVFPIGGATLSGSTTFTFGSTVTSNIDWSPISTLYLSQHEFTTAGNFTGYVLGTAQTLSNVSITNGSSNSIAATLSASPAASLPLAITGTTWANAAQNIGPGTPALSYSDYAAYVQPFLTDRYAPPTSGFLGGPDLTLLRPATPSSGLFINPRLYGCSGTPLIGPSGISNVGQPPIVTDVDYGTLSYGDPYPVNWQRLFQYCQVATVSLPRPNSTATDTFVVTTKQTTTLPTGPVTPLLTAPQSPTLNGNSVFQSATLNSTNVNLSWNPPATGQPYGYVVTAYQLVTTSTGQTLYEAAGRYSTSKTSLSVPFLAPSNTFIFTIDALVDGNATVEKNPNRFKVPNAQAGLVSAPFVIQ